MSLAQKLLLIIVALFLVGTAPLELPAQERRVNRLREHERKVREIIERQREERAQREAEQAEEEEEEEDVPREEQPNRAASSVVLGLKFLSEGGLSDYNLIVEEDESFITEVMMFNIDQNDIDRVRLSINFDKRFIEPVRVFDSAIRANMEEKPKFMIDDRNSIIAYDARLDEPLNAAETPLLRIAWKAVRETPHTGIDFAFSMIESENDYHTAMYVRGNNILGVANDPADGVISGGLMIEQESGDDPDSEPILQGKAEELKELYLGSVASTEEVGLELEGPERPIHAGEEFNVYIKLNNPTGALIDTISLFVKYDPTIFQVVDRDKFNWIRRGINIHDGPYHGDFPWDMHRNNLARNERGIISYQMALSNGKALPSERFATIRFRAIAPALESGIFFIPGKPRDIYHTSIRYFGFERMNLTREYSRPIHFMEVLPARESEQDRRDRGPAVEYVGADELERDSQEQSSGIQPLKIERN